MDAVFIFSQSPGTSPDYHDFQKWNCFGANHIYLLYSSAAAQNLVRGFPPGVDVPSGWKRWCFAE